MPMTRLQNGWHLFMLAIAAVSVSSTEGYDECNYNMAGDNYFICNDTYTSVSYCCMYYEGQFHLCCYSIHFWAQWYFWVGIGLGIILFFIVIGSAFYYCYYKEKRNRNNQESIQPMSFTDTEHPNQSYTTDLPPSYTNVITQLPPSKQTVGDLNQQPGDQLTHKFDATAQATVIQNTQASLGP